MIRTNDMSANTRASDSGGPWCHCLRRLVTVFSLFRQGLTNVTSLNLSNRFQLFSGTGVCDGGLPCRGWDERGTNTFATVLQVGRF